ncbi:MAG: hypothetical protein M3619_33720 [Myxococcota bacterium]|nr:hypothetical protein [Myxococcota bacterium]
MGLRAAVRWPWCVVALAWASGACYQPAPGIGAPCDERAICPTGQTCVAGRCQIGPGEIDAAEPIDSAVADAARLPDASPDALPTTWSTPVAIVSINTNGTESDPSFTADRLVVVFTTGDDMFIGTRASTTAAFTVTALTVLNSTARERSPEISPDGATIYFTSERVVAGNADVYMATRGVAGFEAPVLVPELTSTSSEGDVAISPDGLTAITSRSTFYRATRASTAAPWGPLVSLGNIFGTNPAAPSLTAAGDLYFHAGTDRDLFVARKDGATYATPTPVTELNTVGSRDAAPFIAGDERHLMFDRNGELYESTR